MPWTSIFVVCTLALALAGCRDMGLENNMPLQEAMERPPLDLVAAVHAPDATTETLIIDGRLWVPTGTPLTSGTGQLRPVGSANGTTVYARVWDRPPYDEVFARAGAAGAEDGDVDADDDGPWQPFAPVLGRSGAVPTAGAVGADAGHHTTPEEHAPVDSGAVADTLTEPGPRTSGQGTGL